MAEPIFTKAQFLADVQRLRAMWGNREFWENKDKVQLAMKGITAVYLHTEPKDENEGQFIASVFMATMSEFTRREIYSKIGV